MHGPQTPPVAPAQNYEINPANVNSPMPNGILPLVNFIRQANALPTVQQLLQMGAEVSDAMLASLALPQKAILLIFTAMLGQLDKVNTLLENFSPEEKELALKIGLNNQTALYFAVINGHEAVKERLLAAGASIAQLDALQPNGKSFLTNTVESRSANPLEINAQAIKMLRLLKAGASISEPVLSAINASTPPAFKGVLLYFAAERQDIAAVTRLIELGADVNWIVDFNTPLSAAAENGNIRLAEMLLEKGAKINTNKPEQVEALRALVNTEDEAGNTPLKRAVYAGKVNLTTQLLLSAGARLSDELLRELGNLPLADEILQTLAVNLVTQNKLADATRLLERRTRITTNFLRFAMQNPNKFFLNARDATGDTILTKNIKANQVQAVSQFLAAGADPNKPAIGAIKEGTVELKSPLLLALEHSQQHDSVLALLEKGAVISEEVLNAINSETQAVFKGILLYFAAERQDIAAVQRLIELGADVNWMVDSNTPLSAAAEHGNIRLAEILLEKGANKLNTSKPEQGAALRALVNTEDEAGNTPLKRAVYAGKVNLTQALSSAGAQISDELLEEARRLPLSNEMLQTLAIELVSQNKLLDATRLLERRTEIAPDFIAFARNHANKFFLNARDATGDTILTKSIKAKQIQTVRQLLAAGADPNIEATDMRRAGAAVESKSPLVLALESNCHRDIVFALLQKGAFISEQVIASVNVNTSRELRLTLTCFAAQKGQSDFVLEQLAQDPILLNSAITINAEGPKTPLYFAAKGDQLELVMELLKQGAVIIPSSALELKRLFSTAAGEALVLQTIQNQDFEAFKKLLSLDANITPAITEAAISIATPSQDQRFAVLLLFFAAKQGKLDSIRALIKAGIGPNISDTESNSPLSRALENRQHATADLLIEQGAKLSDKVLEAAQRTDRTDIVDGAKLIEAVTENNLARVRELVEAGARVDLADKDGNTAFCIAAEEGFTEVFSYLLRHDRNKAFNRFNAENLNPLMLSILGDHYDITDLLLAQTDIEIVDALVQAVYDDFHLVKRLVETHAPINGKDKDGNTALCAAVEMGSLDIVDYLLRHGADVNELNAEGLSPLIVAMKHSQFELANRLLDTVVIDVDARGENINSALILAIHAGKLDLVRRLIVKGADIHDQDVVLQENALRLAIRLEKFGIARFLLDLPAADSAYINEQGGINIRKENAVDAAIRSVAEANAAEAAAEAADEARRLLGLPAMYLNRFNAKYLEKSQVLCTEDYQRSALHWAAHHAELPLIQALLAKGAQVNAQDDRGLTPLMLAVEEESTSTEETQEICATVRVLLRAHADKTLRDHGGNTAYDLTCLNSDEHSAYGRLVAIPQPPPRPYAGFEPAALVVMAATVALSGLVSATTNFFGPEADL